MKATELREARQQHVSFPPLCFQRPNITFEMANMGNPSKRLLTASQITLDSK